MISNDYPVMIFFNNSAQHSPCRVLSETDSDIFSEEDVDYALKNKGLVRDKRLARISHKPSTAIADKHIFDLYCAWKNR